MGSFFMINAPPSIDIDFYAMQRSAAVIGLLLTVY